MPDQARYRSRARFDNDLYSEVMPEPHPARATVGADPIMGPWSRSRSWQRSESEEGLRRRSYSTRPGVAAKGE